ncbi:hypothetical protein DSECCO2_630100 [anaerobic digester metagenome]
MEGFGGFEEVAAVVQAGQGVADGGFSKFLNIFEHLQILGDAAVEFFAGEGFVEEIVCAVFDEAGGEDGVAVGGDADDGEFVLAAAAADAAGEFHAVHAGHEVVGDDDLDFGVSFEDREGVRAVVGFVDDEFVGGEQAYEVVAHGLGVVDDEDVDEFIKRDAPHQGDEVIEAVRGFLGDIVHDLLGPDAVADFGFHVAGEDDGGDAPGDDVVHDAPVVGVGQVQVEQGHEKRVVVGIFFKEIARFLEVRSPACVKEQFILDLPDKDAGKDFAVFDDENFFHWARPEKKRRYSLYV